MQGAIRNLEISSEEQTAINEEALSVNEEFQSTNEELLTSKEELQSLNEELTALNGQLQETLERQRTTSNDLQNVLYSTDVATLFLDTDLNIRFFTPATTRLFRIIPTDVGRPLEHFNALINDDALPSDARTMLHTRKPIEREIEAQNGAWYIRRMLPYRTDDKGVDGVVITFTDVTERKEIAKALEAAKQQADRANVAKSRFLAAASHDLRQPLQTLALLQGLWRNAWRKSHQEAYRPSGSDLGRHVGHAEYSAGHQPNRRRRGPAACRELFDQRQTQPAAKEFAYHAQAKALNCTWFRRPSRYKATAGYSSR